MTDLAPAFHKPIGLPRRSVGLILSFLSTGLVLFSMGLADLSLAELLLSIGLLAALNRLPSSCCCCCCSSASWPGFALPPDAPVAAPELLLLLTPPLPAAAPALLLFSTIGRAPRTSRNSPRRVAHSPLARSSSPSSRAPVAAFSSTITRNFACKQGEAWKNQDSSPRSGQQRERSCSSSNWLFGISWN